jgi:hypothetical protein
MKAPMNALLSAMQVLDGHRCFLMYQVIITKFVIVTWVLIYLWKKVVGNQFAFIQLSL